MAVSGKSGVFKKFISGFSSKTEKSATEKKWSKEFRKINRLLKDKAIGDLEAALRPLHKWLNDEADSDAVQPEWLNQIGLIYQAYSGDFTMAEECFRQALLKAEKNEETHEKALAMMNLGSLYLDQSRSAEAVETFKRLKPFIEQYFGPESREKATVCQNLAAAYRLAGNEDKAKAERIESTRILRKLT